MRKQAQIERASVQEPERRDTLKLVRNLGIGAVLLGAGGAYAIGSVRTTMEEFDLTRIGQGKPAIVQIHDPGCAMCRSLQKHTRRALSQFDDEDVIYLVANIHTQEGQELAAKHGVGHVTLLFFDANGTYQKMVHGVKSKDFIAREITAHLS